MFTTRRDIITVAAGGSDIDRISRREEAAFTAADEDANISVLTDDNDSIASSRIDDYSIRTSDSFCNSSTHGSNLIKYKEDFVNNLDITEHTSDSRTSCSKKRRRSKKYLQQSLPKEKVNPSLVDNLYHRNKLDEDDDREEEHDDDDNYSLQQSGAGCPTDNWIPVIDLKNTLDNDNDHKYFNTQEGSYSNGSASDHNSNSSRSASTKKERRNSFTSLLAEIEEAEEAERASQASSSNIHCSLSLGKNLIDEGNKNKHEINKYDSTNVKSNDVRAQNYKDVNNDYDCCDQDNDDDNKIDMSNNKSNTIENKYIYIKHNANIGDNQSFNDGCAYNFNNSDGNEISKREHKDHRNDEKFNDYMQSLNNYFATYYDSESDANTNTIKNTSRRTTATASTKSSSTTRNSMSGKNNKTVSFSRTRTRYFDDDSDNMSEEEDNDIIADDNDRYVYYYPSFRNKKLPEYYNDEDDHYSRKRRVSSHDHDGKNYNHSYNNDYRYNYHGDEYSNINSSHLYAIQCNKYDSNDHSGSNSYYDSDYYHHQQLNYSYKQKQPQRSSHSSYQQSPSLSAHQYFHHSPSLSQQQRPVVSSSPSSSFHESPVVSKQQPPPSPSSYEHQSPYSHQQYSLSAYQQHQRYHHQHHSLHKYEHQQEHLQSLSQQEPQQQMQTILSTPLPHDTSYVTANASVMKKSSSQLSPSKSKKLNEKKSRSSSKRRSQKRMSSNKSTKKSKRKGHQQPHDDSRSFSMLCVLFFCIVLPVGFLLYAFAGPLQRRMRNNTIPFDNNAAATANQNASSNNVGPTSISSSVSQPVSSTNTDEKKPDTIGTLGCGSALKVGRINMYLTGEFQREFSVNERDLLEQIFRTSYSNATNGNCNGPYRRTISNLALASQAFHSAPLPLQDTFQSDDSEENNNINNRRVQQQASLASSIIPLPTNLRGDHHSYRQQKEKQPLHLQQKDYTYHLRQRQLQKLAVPPQSQPALATTTNAGTENINSKTILMKWMVTVQCGGSDGGISNCLDEEPLFSSPDDNSIYHSTNSDSATTTSTSHETFFNLFVDTFSNSLIAKSSDGSIQSGYYGAIIAQTMHMDNTHNGLYREKDGMVDLSNGKQYYYNKNNDNNGNGNTNTNTVSTTGTTTTPTPYIANDIGSLSSTTIAPTKSSQILPTKDQEQYADRNTTISNSTENMLSSAGVEIDWSNNVSTTMAEPHHTTSTNNNTSINNDTSLPNNTSDPDS